jgi:hypothetical protein
LKWRTYRPSDREKIDETPLCAARNRLNGYACAFATATICTSECIGARRRDDEAPAGFELARGGTETLPSLGLLGAPMRRAACLRGAFLRPDRWLSQRDFQGVGRRLAALSLHWVAARWSEDTREGERKAPDDGISGTYRLSQIGGLTPSSTSAPAPSGPRGRPGWRIGICRSTDTRSRCIASSPRAVAEARRSAHRSVSSRRLRCAPSPGGQAFGRGATSRAPHRSPRAKARSVARRR